MMKRRALSLSFLFLLCAALLAAPVSAAEVPPPVGDIYVQDTANMFSSGQIAELLDLGRYLDDRTGAQIAVLTIPPLEDEEPADYALKAFRKYELGHGGDNNGVLLLFSMKDEVNDIDGQVYIEVGYGLEGILPDGKVGRIIDEYAVPYLDAGNYDAAVENTYKQLFNEVASEYNLDRQADTVRFAPEASGDGQGPSLLQIILYSAIVLVVVFLDFKFFGGMLTYTLIRMLAIFASRGGGGGGGGGGPRSGGGGSAGGGGAGRSW